MLVDTEVMDKRTEDRLHSTSVLPMFDELLAEAQISLSDIDAVAFGRGPGMFTGIRIGAGIIQGIAYAADKPVIPVSSLRSLAAAVDADRVAVIQDARMSEVYFCAYQREAGIEAPFKIAPLMEEQLLAPDCVQLPDDSDAWVLAGSGCRPYRHDLKPGLMGRIDRFEEDAVPGAADVARLAVMEYLNGAMVAPDKALPVYLRNDVAKKGK